MRVCDWKEEKYWQKKDIKLCDQGFIDCLTFNCEDLLSKEFTFDIHGLKHISRENQHSNFVSAVSWCESVK